MLKLKNITKDYYVGDQTIEALRGIDVAFRENEFVAILGPSGCGKTTMMNIVGGLDQYTSGDLIINNYSTVDFKDYDWDNYRNKRVGFVFQSYNLIMHQNVLSNVELALTLSGISAKERKERALEVLDKVGLADQAYKKPNQLSGGQMQRVAIARALINEPEILLADEPTGALDTETSKQILDLIKEVANDRLVIMVTHNPDLAHKYANRIITMLDGKLTSDSNPYDYDPEVKIKAKKVKSNVKEKTSMSFFTALGLSFKNLLTKKWRTFLTAIAGSIGIIGVGLILAVSSGTNNYVEKVQEDILSSNPLTISESAFDIQALMNNMLESTRLEKFPLTSFIYARTFNLANMTRANNITQEYVDYVKTIDDTLYNDMIFTNGQKLTFYKENNDGTFGPLVTGDPEVDQLASVRPIEQLIPKADFLAKQFDVLAGNLPTNSRELVLIVNEYNEMLIQQLQALGLVDSNVLAKDIEVAFNEVIGHKLYLSSHNNTYDFLVEENKFVKKTDLIPDIELSISGIIRMNEASQMPMLNEGLGYTIELYNEFFDLNYTSELVTYIHNNEDNEDVNIKTVLPLEPFQTIPNQEASKIKNIKRYFGANNLANEIKIYAKDFETNDLIKAKLDRYNEAQTNRDNEITYTDFSAIFGSIMNQIVNIVTIILVAFTSISLLVSSIMIGIITYVSVLERSKEIGILRSIGARKKDITRVFNAETFIIGVLSGIIGIGVTYLLSLPINIIVNNLTDVKNIASLLIIEALILVLITVSLTVLAGLIPAKGASKKDPVEALRTE